MVDRVFWFNHRVPQDPTDRMSQFAKSASNSYEVGLVAGLVEYLIAQNVYNLHDVAVLVSWMLNCAWTSLIGSRLHTMVSLLH
jgi:hypothetical protein